MNKRMKNMIIILIIVFGGIIAWNLLKAFMIKRFFANYEAPAVTISSVTAQQKNWQPYLSAVGNFVAINGVEVNSEASGNVVSIHFDSGQFIEKDKPLIDIDDQIDQAVLKNNQAELTLKEINYKRQTDLFKRNATPGSSVDEAKATLQQAQANVEKTKAQIAQKHISAPFSGQTGIRQVNLGQYITPGQTSIVSLQSLDPLFLEFYLPEQLFKNIHINQVINFHLDEFPDNLFQGKISAINSRVDTSTHNIQVQATLPNCPMEALTNSAASPLIKVTQLSGDNRKLVICNSALNQQKRISSFIFIPGMFASIRVEQPSVPNTIVLPSTAISYSLYGNAVFVIEKDKDGKKDQKGQDLLFVRRQFVTTGEQQGNYTIIKKGIDAGQLVVSSGEMKLQNGTRVTINNSVPLNTDSNPEQLDQ